MESLQDRHSPHNICFGCGPANPDGLQIKSRVEGDELVCDWTPKPHHEAFPGVLNGGIIGTILDCHCNWTAAHHLMIQRGVDKLPCSVTAEYSIKLKRPTPSNAAVQLRSRVVATEGDKVTVEAELIAGGKVCATCRGVFVGVQPDHPAYHRW